MTTKLFLCGILCLNSHFGCHYRSGRMDEQVGSPCPVAPHESNCCCISQDQYSQLEERLNQMQEDIRTTNRMLHELSSLVHQQLQTAVTNERNRRLSHSGISPNNAMFAEGAPRVSLAGLNAFALVASDALEIMDITDADLKTTDLRSASPAQRPLPNSSGKKLSIPLAVPDPTLSAQWLSKIEIAEVDKVAKPPGLLAKLWSPLQSGLNGLTKIIPVNITKILPLHKDTETPSHDDETLVRRFSVSAINLVKAQSIAVRQSKNNPSEQEREDLMVSPQDIISARKLEGEVSRFTLRHDSPYRTAWDLGVIALVLLDLVVTPLSLGFNYQSAFLDFYDTAESVVFVVDFLIRMFSSYIDEHGNLVSGPKQTIAYYVTSGWALPDLLSWFPFELFSSSSHSNVIGFFKFLRLAKVSHLAHRLNSAKKAGIVRFLLLLGIVFTISHLLTCYWSWVAVGWRAHIHEGTFVPKSLFDEYSLCWSLVIGSVNASPPIMYTTAELISVACFMLVGNVLQASVFGAVAALIASIDENEAAYSKKIITVLERCSFLGIPDGLTKRIRGYYENLWRETKSVSSDADLFIEELSPALVCEVKFQLYRDMLKQIPFLSSKILAPAVIEVLVLHLRTIIYMQDDVLIRKGEFGDWMGFIGSKGSVGILDPNSEMAIVIQILRKGDYFGEMALLQRTKRAATAVALTWVQIHVLYRQDLDYVKELYPTQTEILENEISKYKHMQKSGPQS